MIPRHRSPSTLSYTEELIPKRTLSTKSALRPADCCRCCKLSTTSPSATRAQSSSPCTARPTRHAEGPTMPKHDIFAITFARVYPLYVNKAERKNRTKAEVDQIICWLTGYN